MKADSPEKRVLHYGDRKIVYQLIRDGYRRMRIVVNRDLSVRVTVPRHASDGDVEDLLRGKARWISRKLDQVEEFHPLPGPLKYVSGETLRFLGRQYRLRVEQGTKAPAKLKGKYLHVSVPDKDDVQTIRRIVDLWYRIQAERTFERYMNSCMKVAARHGVPETRLKIRKMRTRWGSCSSKGNITLNTNLVQAPVHCIEYVVMHELCHLRHHNHSKAFYSLLTRCMPDWENRRRELNKVVLPS